MRNHVGASCVGLTLLPGFLLLAPCLHAQMTMPGMAAYESEGVVYAKYILQTKPDARIAILAQNDDFGRDYVAGFKRALGAKAGDGAARLRAAVALAEKKRLKAPRLHAAIAAAPAARRALKWAAYAALFQLGDDVLAAGCEKRPNRATQNCCQDENLTVGDATHLRFDFGNGPASD